MVVVFNENLVTGSIFIALKWLQCSFQSDNFTFDILVVFISFLFCVGIRADL